MPRRFSAAVVLTLAACAHPVDPTSVKPSPDDDPTLERPWNVAKIAARVAALRRLPLKAPISVEVVDAATFAKEYASDEMDSHIFERDAFWHAFAFAPQNVSVADRLRAGIATNATGLYELKRKRLLVLADSPSEAMMGETLVHEIDHALQDQSFDLAPLARGSTGADELLAKRALVEGDATLTELSYLISTGKFGDHALPTFVDGVEHGTLMQSIPMNRRPDSGMPFARAVREFPYTAGFPFAASLYRTGGYSLVDEAFHHPPKSTEQVLHPEKYFAGEPPVVLEKPIAPDGYVDVVSGRLGELTLRQLLAQCGPSQRDDATGWGGDTFSVVTDIAGKLAVVASTVWDDAAAAERFEGRIRGRGACLEKRLDAEARRSVGIETAALRDGDRVAFVQGLAPDASDVALHALLALHVSRPPADPPFGAKCAMTPLFVPENVFLRHGEMQGDVYASAPLGLEVPYGRFDPRASEDGEIELTRRDAVSAAVVRVRVVLSAPTDPLERRVSTHVVAAMAGGSLKDVDYDGDSIEKTGVGPGHAFRWTSPRGQIAIVFGSLCAGRATLVVEARYGGLGPWAELLSVLEKIKSDPESDACEWLAANDGEPALPAACDVRGAPRSER